MNWEGEGSQPTQVQAPRGGGLNQDKWKHSGTQTGEGIGRGVRGSRVLSRTISLGRSYG